MGLRFGSVLEVWVLTKFAKCTSRSVKRSSGARVLIPVLRIVRPLDRSFDLRSIARSLGCSLDRLIARSFDRSPWQPHVAWSQDMFGDHMGCVVITKYLFLIRTDVLWTQHIPCDQQTCVVITTHVVERIDYSVVWLMSCYRLVRLRCPHLYPYSCMWLE